MKLNNIQEELRRLITLLDEWDQSQPIPEIERDLMLEKLRAIYEVIRTTKPASATSEPAIDSTETFEEEAIAIPVGFGLGDLLISEPLSGTTDQSVTSTLIEPESESDPTPEEITSLNVENIFESTPAPAPAVEEFPVAAQPLAVEQQEPAPAADPIPDQSSDTSTSKPEEQPVAVESVPQQRSMTANLFGEEEVVRHRHKQRVIMSLYDTDTTMQSSESAPISSPKSNSEPAKADSDLPEMNFNSEISIPTESSTTEQVSATSEISDEEFEIEEISLEDFSSEEDSSEATTPLNPAEKDHTTESPAPILGEVINTHVQTLADTLPAPHNIASELRHQPVTDLESAIGINDKFLLIRDLFDGDSTAYTETIRTLNTFDDFDECMIHIAVNYSWNPNSDGAKLLTELLERKLL